MIDVTVDPVAAFKALLGRYTKVQNKATILHDWNSEQAAADFNQALVDCAGNIQKASKLFFATHLQGKSVQTKLGLVRINSDSRGKVHYGWRDLKSYAVPKIPDILINGDVGDFVARYKDRPDSKEGFFEFKQWIDCADFRILARLKVAQDAVGYMVYTLSTKKETLNRDPTISNELRGFEAGLDSSKGVSFDSIEPDSPDDVNIEILSIVDKATGKALTEAEALARLGQNPTDSSQEPAMTFEQFNKITTVAMQKSNYGRVYRVFFVGLKNDEKFDYYKHELTKFNRKSYQSRALGEEDYIRHSLKKNCLLVVQSDARQSPRTAREAKEMAFAVLCEGKAFSRDMVKGGDSLPKNNQFDSLHMDSALDSTQFDSLAMDSAEDPVAQMKALLARFDAVQGKATKAEALARLGQSPTDSGDNSDYAKYLANPMLKSRMNKSLDQRYLIDGKVISGRQLLTDKVNDGWTIGKKEEIDHKKNEQLKKELHEFLTQGGFGHWRSERRHELDTLLAKGGGRFNEVVIKPILEDQNSGDQIDLNKFELAFVEHLMAVRSKISNQSSSTPNGTQFDSLSATDDTMDSAVAAYADQLKFFLARLGVSK